MQTPPPSTSVDYCRLGVDIRQWASKLGFEGTGVSDTDLSHDEIKFLNWLGAGYHGEMHYMTHHGTKRTQPSDLLPNTIRIVTVRMRYWPEAKSPHEVLADGTVGYISRYALGGDYHKIMRRRLQKLADKIVERIGPFGYRAFVDSAPVLEKALSRKAGLGWVGKHTNLIDQEIGSYFFLGELYTDLPLPTDEPVSEHCGRCTACIDACPTQAIVAPYQLDARLCISYLTIEHPGTIPLSLRSRIGNRIYGCDDCQLVCPWNRFTEVSPHEQFATRHHLDNTQLVTLFAWSEVEFTKYTEGSALRRLGYERWQRNIAVAMGNAPADPNIVETLKHSLNTTTPLVREHIQWALDQQDLRAKDQLIPNNT